MSNNPKKVSSSWFLTMLRSIFKRNTAPLPPFLPNAETYIQGNIEKLVQVATVQGDLIILSKEAEHKALSRLGDQQSQDDSWEVQERQQQIDLFEESSEFITVTLKSERFGRSIKFKVPINMKVWAFRELIIETLSLPRKMLVRQLGISFEFVYTLHHSGLLEDHKTLKEAQLADGAYIELYIDVMLSDPNLSDVKEELNRVSSTKYLAAPIVYILHFIHIVILEEKAIRQHERLYGKYAKDILKEPWFNHLGIPSPRKVEKETVTRKIQARIRNLSIRKVTPPGIIWAVGLPIAMQVILLVNALIVTIFGFRNINLILILLGLLGLIVSTISLLTVLRQFYNLILVLLGEEDLIQNPELQRLI